VKIPSHEDLIAAARRKRKSTAVTLEVLHTQKKNGQQ
jgi:hypothetical protein